MIWSQLLTRLRNRFRVSKDAVVDIDPTVNMSGCRVVVRGSGNLLKIGKNTKLRDTHIEIIGENCSIIIDDSCMIGHNCYLSAKESGSHIRIHRDCGLSRNVKMMTSDGHPIFIDNERINYPADITVGEHVWVGDNVTVLKGVSIGSGSVVGINSTVTKDVDSAVVVVGNPARRVREGITWKA